MQESTMSRKRAAKVLESYLGTWLVGKVIDRGRNAMSELTREIGRMVVESVFLLEREEIAGPDYHPRARGVSKWASQPGSVFMGKHKERVMVPRLRGPQGEIPLRSYQRLKNPEEFSQELLNLWLSGMSGRRYAWLIEDARERLGVSASSVSRHLVLAGAKRLEEFRERRMDGFEPFAVFIDSVNRGGNVFIVACGVNICGEKQVLGFWEGATENHEICEMLFCDLERRGLRLHGGIVFITDGGKGIIKALRRRFGKKVLHQRCTVHKCRNICGHLPKRYRPEARRRFRRAIDMNTYEDAHRELLALHRWLRSINGSAAESLKEGMEELLLLHVLHIPFALRRSLRSTNAIEGLFSRVRFCEKNIRRYHSSSMAQRWLGTVLFNCEKGFRKIKGHQCIRNVSVSIAKYQGKLDTVVRAA
jgi:putative transposase